MSISFNSGVPRKASAHVWNDGGKIHYYLRFNFFFINIHQWKNKTHYFFTWIRLRTFSWTAWGGSYLGPITLIRSDRKSLFASCMWNLLPQFFTQVSKHWNIQIMNILKILFSMHLISPNIKEIKCVDQYDNYNWYDSTHSQCVHDSCVIFAHVLCQSLPYCSGCIFGTTEKWQSFFNKFNSLTDLGGKAITSQSHKKMICFLNKIILF